MSLMPQQTIDRPQLLNQRPIKWRDSVSFVNQAKPEFLLENDEVDMFVTDSHQGITMAPTNSNLNTSSTVNNFVDTAGNSSSTLLGFLFQPVTYLLGLQPSNPPPIPIENKSNPSTIPSSTQQEPKKSKSQATSVHDMKPFQLAKTAEGKHALVLSKETQSSSKGWVNNFRSSVSSITYPFKQLSTIVERFGKDAGLKWITIFAVLRCSFFKRQNVE